MIKEEQQRAWLERKLGDAASMIRNLQIQPHPPLYFRKDQRPGKIVTVSFEGELVVGDAQALAHLLKGDENHASGFDRDSGIRSHPWANPDHSPGIGPAKAFGCGLLLARKT